MAGKTRPKTIAKPERLCSAGENLEIWRVDHRYIREQDINARVMSPDMTDRLIENIRKEKRMESLPFGVAREGHIELVSGHHRIRAAVAAKVTEFPILVDLRDLSRSQVRAKQLAHNAINGMDDIETLTRIFAEIDNVDDRLESFVTLDATSTQQLDDTVRILNEEIAIEWPVLSFAFLPMQRDKFDIVGERLAKQVPKDSDHIWLLPDEVAQRFTDCLNNLSRAEDIRLNGNIIGRMVEIVEAHLDSQPETAEGE